MGEDSSISDKIKALSEKLAKWQYEYYVLARPSVADKEYDTQFDLLLNLEKENPQLKRADSPTERVGSDLSHDFPEVEHTIPVLSLDKAYSVGELLNWSSKNSSKVGKNEFSMVVEEKIDGISIVLYYEEGLLTKAVTRGNGSIGNDVTANIKTIGAVPLRLTEPETVAVRGEIYLPLKSFDILNSKLETPYSNPRNLVAGTVRRKRSSETASVPLQIFIYEGFFEKSEQFSTHKEILAHLKKLGFRLNPRTSWFSTHPDGDFRPMDQLQEWVTKMTEERDSLDYEIDGLVLKVNELPLRESLGYTGHHPRWAIAYKFESPVGETLLNSIDVQVGRTGRITPVARIEPVEIAGSIISNVTLHNQDYIDLLEVAPGDKVSVSKRGDVIPAIEAVVEKNAKEVAYKLPKECPVCNSILIEDGAHLFCRNNACPSQQLGRLLFFVGRAQMNIDGLGDETVEYLFKKGFIKDVADFYSFDYSQLYSHDGFAEKKVSLIEQGLEKSKSQPYQRVLSSLGFKELGPKASELLIENGYPNIDLLISAAQDSLFAQFELIKGIGDRTASGIVKALTDSENLKLISRLKEAGLQFKAKKREIPTVKQIFENQSWCVTGSFKTFSPRDKAKDEIKLRGGRVVSTVSGATTHLLVGEKEGSKLTKAQSLGIEIVNEQQFLELLGRE